MASSPPLTYAATGVAPAGGPLAGLLAWVRQTLAFRQGHGEPILAIGHYANVLRIGDNLGLAISTDGVGSKVLVAEMLERYDTIGIDCVAANVNDVICVGAEPLALLDYVAVQEARADVLEQLGKGLHDGAAEAEITIPGGELAQLPEIVAGIRPGSGIDLTGTCVGTVALDQVISGQRLAPGDLVIGLASSGIHTNGLTLARRALFDVAGYRPDQYVPEFGRSAGEELLAPSRIYVRPIRRLLALGIDIRGLFHISGDGLLNLTRTGRPLGFDLSYLPPPPPVFRTIADCARVASEEMYRVFNMGIGFCVAAPPEAESRVRSVASEYGIESWALGEVVPDPESRVWLRPLGLVGRGDSFRTG